MIARLIIAKPFEVPAVISGFLLLFFLLFALHLPNKIQIADCDRFRHRRAVATAVGRTGVTY